MKEFGRFEWFEWFGPSPIEPFNSAADRPAGLVEGAGVAPPGGNARVGARCRHHPPQHASIRRIVRLGQNCFCTAPDSKNFNLAVGVEIVGGQRAQHACDPRSRKSLTPSLLSSELQVQKHCYYGDGNEHRTHNKYREPVSNSVPTAVRLAMNTI